MPNAFNSLLSTFLTYKWISIPSREKTIRSTYVKDAMGVLGLKLMRLSYDTNYFPTGATTEQVKKMFLSFGRRRGDANSTGTTHA